MNGQKSRELRRISEKMKKDRFKVKYYSHKERSSNQFKINLSKRLAEDCVRKLYKTIKKIYYKRNGLIY